MIRFVIALAALFLAGAATASAQTYPQRPVRFILQFGPGAGVDITARMIAERLSARWGKAVVVENRPGGDGLVAINAFTSANDDHTLLFVPTSAFTAHPYTHEKLPYDSERDLVPIVSVTTIVVAFAVPGDSEVKSLAEFVALARAKPDTLNVAAAAGNSELIMSSFIKTQNLPVAKVPYRDILQAPNDLAQGRIQALLTSYAAMLGLIQSGKIKVLAITSSKRVAIAPDVPTVTEAGFPFLGMDSLIGIYGPREATSPPTSPTTTCASGSPAPNCSARSARQGRELAGGHRARRRGDPARGERPLRGVRRSAGLPQGLSRAAQHVRRRPPQHDARLSRSPDQVGTERRLPRGLSQGAEDHPARDRRRRPGLREHHDGRRRRRDQIPLAGLAREGRRPLHRHRHLQHHPRPGGELAQRRRLPRQVHDKTRSAC
jgi:tripartite-type tricarboxylate transporter receptor subunit TctC